MKQPEIIEKPVLKLKKTAKKPSKQNRLLEYLKITDSDCFIAEYVDFLSFYGPYLPETLILWCRDNDAWANFFWFHVSRRNEGKWLKNIILKIIYYYDGKLVDIWQLNEFSKDWKRLLRCQLYGKGLLIVNRENLRDELENLLFFFGMSEIVLTRIDYTVDCEKMNFSKPNTLKAKVWGQFHDLRTGDLEYLGFGSLWVSPLFIRYYDKKKDLKKTKFEWLYPEYLQYDTVMRYELQVSSDGISAEDKNKHVYDLKAICNFNHKIKKNTRSHKKYTTADKDFKTVQQIILAYKKTNNRGQLSRILMLLEWCML